MPESLPEFLVAQRLRARSLGDHIVTFATLLADRGYATSTTKELLRLVADLGHWLGHRRDEPKISMRKASANSFSIVDDVVGGREAMVGRCAFCLGCCGTQVSFAPWHQPR